MTSRDPFNTSTEEVKRLADELREVREVVREVSQRLARMETRAKRAFPTSFPKEAERAKSEVNQSHTTLSSDEALQMYESFVEQVKIGDPSGVQSRLESMSRADLMRLRQEVGVSLRAKKPSRIGLVSAILSRASESAMLTAHARRNDLVSAEEMRVSAEGADASPFEAPPGVPARRQAPELPIQLATQRMEHSE